MMGADLLHTLVATDNSLAKSADEQALMYQFLEWKVNNIDNADDVRISLKKLNDVLKSSTYLCSNSMKAIDVLLTMSLGKILVNFTHFEKETLGNVLRWYTQVSSEAKQPLPPVFFQRMPIYH
ncbi:eukaryotic translation elongation factor 1 epsilon-1 [Paragonimus westermani]|uniref:Eukaryotic translation elongation factor 1 epsilon-1 n=1 Tax=Paragonimus westermani TaxID=34504 RepID=A0A5J4NXT6_9TREM|nr:eukaryotic translation elongation factor 1 epsilon-1 [Paragonimus westermani]